MLRNLAADEMLRAAITGGESHQSPVTQLLDLLFK